MFSLHQNTIQNEQKMNVHNRFIVLKTYSLFLLICERNSEKSTPIEKESQIWKYIMYKRNSGNTLHQKF